MKNRIVAFLMLCVVLAGCANSKNQPEQPAEPVQMETLVEEASVIRPLPETVMEALENSTVNVAFTQADFSVNEAGNIILRMNIYAYDKFDMVDISSLKNGDMILLSGEEVLVNTVERNDYGTVLVNGGLDEGGFDLETDDNGIYYVQGYSDMKSWYLAGEGEYPLSDDFFFTDNADLDLGTLTYNTQELLDGVPDANIGYQPQNTTVRIENGQIVEMVRIYMP